MQTRENALHQWLKTIYPQSDYLLHPLAGDASFRRYYRLQQPNTTHIIMDAPPDKIKLAPFVYVRDLLAEQGVCTPKIHAIDHHLGFALLEDFGNVLFSDAVKNEPSQTLYQNAIALLAHMQNHPVRPPLQLQTFDQAFMLQELSLFDDWFLQRYLNIKLKTEEYHLINTTFQTLTAHIANQPQVLVHRDYHSRNIMILEQTSVNAYKFGIIDFQDAVIGPLTYDLVSLLKDCYIQLPRDTVLAWVQYFYDLSALAQQYMFTDFLRAFDWCGLQRHLRVLGTFSRLHLRDGKSNYLSDLPRVYQYVVTCVTEYPEFQAFSQWLQERIHPYFESKQA